MGEKTVLPKWVKIAGVVSLYWCVSITMVFLGKRVLRSEVVGLDAPFLVTFTQCLVSVALCRLLTLLAGRSGEFPSLGRYSYIPYSVRFDPKASREVLPVSACFVCMLVFNNLCLRELGVAFYNVGRSLTTVCNVALSYFVLNKTTPPLALLCCAGIVLGYLLGVNTEGDLVDLSYSGVLYGALASFFVSLNAIMTSRVLPALGDSPWKLGYYNNLNACLLLLPPLLLSSDLRALRDCPQLASPHLWASLVLLGGCGLAVGFVSTWQIQVTTPLTHNISGTAKACAQTVIAVVWFGTPKTALWWLSNAVVLLGSFLYAVARSRAMKVKVQAEKEQSEEKV